MVRSEDELAAVLAHESAHVVARHAAERITQMGALEVARVLAYWRVPSWAGRVLLVYWQAPAWAEAGNCLRGPASTALCSAAGRH